MKILTILILSFHFLWAEERDPAAPFQQYTAEGSVLLFKVIPQDRIAKIFVVGRKAAQINLNKDARVLSVYLNSKNTETLKLTRHGDYYEAQGLPRANEPYELSIRAEVQGHTEDVKVKINPRVP